MISFSRVPLNVKCWKQLWKCVIPDKFIVSLFNDQIICLWISSFYAYHTLFLTCRFLLIFSIYSCYYVFKCLFSNSSTRSWRTWSSWGWWVSPPWSSSCGRSLISPSLDPSGQESSSVWYFVYWKCPFIFWS